jgi:putative membrane protein
MKRTKYASLAALTAVGLAAAAVAQTRSSAPAAQNQSIVTAEAAREAPAQNRSTEFLSEALRSNLAEAKIGELAAQRGRDPRVRDYGARLHRDHTAHAAEIRRILEPLKITVAEEPSAEAISHEAVLTRLSAEEFDAAFVQMMVWSHTEAIEKYGAQTHANPDKALSDFASKSLPMLREHLAVAESLR